MAEDTWTYQAEFNVSQEMLGRRRVDLVLDGVDTVAEVYINEKLVGNLNNAHRYSLMGLERSHQSFLHERGNMHVGVGLE